MCSPLLPPLRKDSPYTEQYIVGCLGRGQPGGNCANRIFNSAFPGMNIAITPKRRITVPRFLRPLADLFSSSFCATDGKECALLSHGVDGHLIKRRAIRRGSATKCCSLANHSWLKSFVAYLSEGHAHSISAIKSSRRSSILSHPCKFAFITNTSHTTVAS